uniref:Uncharacterized protein n=1 Tax=Arundo donax TaxID=35708 RepID=A0A0A8ZHZ5_ARUDO
MDYGHSIRFWLQPNGELCALSKYENYAHRAARERRRQTLHGKARA